MTHKIIIIIIMQIMTFVVIAIMCNYRLELAWGNAWQNVLKSVGNVKWG